MKISTTLLLIAGITLSGTAARAQSNIRVSSKCIQRDGHLESIPVNYNTATGDFTVTVNGTEKLFEDAYPADKSYAASASWYINNEPILIKGKQYVKYGLPRILGTTDVTKLSVYKGVTVYAEDPSSKNIEVVYLPVRPDCEFQPYQLDLSKPKPARKKARAKRS